MGKEYEAKFLDIDYKKMCKKLKEIGAKRVHKTKMFQRKVYDLCDPKVRGFGRVRDEAGTVTMTTKIFIDPKFPEENEIEICGSFEDGCKFIESLGLKPRAYQQTYREKWTHKIAHEITFDCVPGLPMFQEATMRAKGEEITPERKAEILKEITDRYDRQTTPYYAASRLWVDGIIDPLETRKVISMGIEAANHAPIEKRYNVGVIQT